MLLQTKEASLMIKKRKMCTQYPSSTRMQNEKFRKDYKHEEKLEKFSGDPQYLVTFTITWLHILGNPNPASKLYTVLLLNR